MSPEEAGKPLHGRLKGLWSARVGSYRIIYSIEGSRRSPKVIVRAIKHRSQAYEFTNVVTEVLTDCSASFTARSEIMRRAHPGQVCPVA